MTRKLTKLEARIMKAVEGGKEFEVDAENKLTIRQFDAELRTCRRLVKEGLLLAVHPEGAGRLVPTRFVAWVKDEASCPKCHQGAKNSSGVCEQCAALPAVGDRVAVTIVEGPKEPWTKETKLDSAFGFYAEVVEVREIDVILRSEEDGEHLQFENTFGGLRMPAGLYWDCDDHNQAVRIEKATGEEGNTGKTAREIPAALADDLFKAADGLSSLLEKLGVRTQLDDEFEVLESGKQPAGEAAEVFAALKQLSSVYRRLNTIA